jgi:hypothetical protein
MSREPSIAAVARRRRRTSWPLLLSVALLAALVVACTPDATPSPSAGAQGSGAPLGSGETPVPTRWPGDVVTATIALGAADASFSKLGNDLQQTVDTEDMQGLLQVTTDGLTFLKGAQQNIPKLQGYPETKSLGDTLAAAYQQMIDGLQKTHDALVSGDAAGVTAGFQQFVAGNTLYATVRADLSDKAQQAIFMQRIYLR